MAKELTEDELNLRRKARRRLVGAVALTLVVVLVLPMVLDSEPKPSGKDIDLRIPNPDKVGEFVPGAAVTENPTVKNVETLSPSTSAVVTTPASASASVPVTALSQTTTLRPAPVVPPVSQQSDDAPSKPVVSKAPETKSEDKSSGSESFVAQVGAYSNAATAKKELKKLKSWGFKAYTEQAGDKVRVRVGPYPNRDKAEKAAHLLEKRGLHPVVLGDK